MSVVAFSPHNDDVELFACYSLLRHRPLVVVCFQSFTQEKFGIYASNRDAETGDAMSLLDLSWEQLGYQDDRRAHPGLVEDIAGYADRHQSCIAPMPIAGGHEQHNLIGELALQAFGRDRCLLYCTYIRGDTRLRGTPVEYEYAWPAIKLRAMACHASQINLPLTRPWFTDWTEEYTA